MFTPSDKCPRRDACVQNGFFRLLLYSYFAVNQG